MKRNSGTRMPPNTKCLAQAVVYCRVSTKEQTQNLSLPTQERVCREYCQKQGFTVARVFVEEGESAKTTERTRLIELLDFCRVNKGHIQHVVVYKIDRFSRQRYDHAVLGAQLLKYGVTLKSATEPITDDPAGKLMEHILSDFAQFDNDSRSARTIEGMKAALNSGRWTFEVPIGYRRRVDHTGRAVIEPDPEIAPLVRTAFETYVTGAHSKAEVLRKVTAMGLRTRRGKMLTPQTFQEMLRKPIYTGILCVPKWGIDHVKGKFEALVSEEIFERVQAVLEGRSLSVTSYERNHPDFPLRRFVSCGDCGTPITGSWSRGRNQKYGYYRCRNRSCLALNVPKDQFERAFLDYLGGLRPKPEYVRLFREIVLDLWKHKEAEAKSSNTVIQCRIDELQNKRQQLLGAYLYQKTIVEDLYRQEDDRLSQELTLAKMELHDAELEQIDIEGVLAFAETLILDAQRLWLEGTLEQRQHLQKLLFPKGVTYSTKSGFGTAETSLFFRWLAVVSEKKDSLASPTGFEPLLRYVQSQTKKPANSKLIPSNHINPASGIHPQISPKKGVRTPKK